MKKIDTTQVIRKRGDAMRKGATDWARLEAMTDAESLEGALAEPDAQPFDEKRLTGMRRVSRVKTIRERLGMTQAAFAQAFHLPLTTLRDWEQRRSIPDAPARALLLAIERDPERMRELLAEEAH